MHIKNNNNTYSVDDQSSSCTGQQAILGKHFKQPLIIILKVPCHYSYDSYHGPSLFLCGHLRERKGPHWDPWGPIHQDQSMLIF